MVSEHPREFLTKIYAEGKTGTFTATITKSDGVTPVPLANLDAVTLTLYAEKTAVVINARTASDILNTGGGTVHATSGLLTLILSPLDMAILLDGQTYEQHIALVEWTYDTVQKGGQEISFKVQNLLKVAS